MKIAIIGAGNVGGALGRSLAKAGHEIIYGVRDGGGKTQPPSAKSAAIPDAAQAADVVVLATPWAAMTDVIRSLGDIKGKVLIDCTNPLALNGDGSLGLAVGFTTSGAEEIERQANGAHVIKAFNIYGWENFENSAYPGHGDLRPIMFYCGDHDGGKAIASQLASDLGFEPLDVGGLGMARSLEPLALMWIRLAIREGRNPNFTWARLRR